MQFPDSWKQRLIRDKSTLVSLRSGRRLLNETSSDDDDIRSGRRLLNETSSSDDDGSHP